MRCAKCTQPRRAIRAVTFEVEGVIRAGHLLRCPPGVGHGTICTRISVTAGALVGTGRQTVSRCEVNRKIEHGSNSTVKFSGELGGISKELLHVLPPLPQPYVAVHVEAAPLVYKVLSDAEASSELRRAADEWVPGRPGQERRMLERLQGLLETVESGLKEHFRCEEEYLLAALERHGDQALVSALKELLAVHQEIAGALARLRNVAHELGSAGHSRHLWLAKAADLRASLETVRRQVEQHAGQEDRLFRMARDAVASKTEASD